MSLIKIRFLDSKVSTLISSYVDVAINSHAKVWVYEQLVLNI